MIAAMPSPQRPPHHRRNDILTCVAVIVAVVVVSLLAISGRSSTASTSVNVQACNQAQASLPGTAQTADQIPGLQKAFDEAVDPNLQIVIQNLLVTIQYSSDPNETVIAENNLENVCKGE